MNIRFEKIARVIERDIRNQVVIDQMKTLNRKGKLMVLVRRHRIPLLFGAVALAWTFAWCWAIVAANAAECPDPGVKCKVLFLNEQEERMLMGQNGILDTAAQARSLDLGQFAVYLKTRIGSAPAGEVKPVEQPKPAENKPAAPVDNPK
jgi:hypothetical protein